MFFLLLYSICLYFVISTIGHPYRDFLLRAEETGLDVMEDTALLRAEAVHKFKDISDEGRLNTDKIGGWFSWVGMDTEEYDQLKKKEKEQSVLDAMPKKMRVPGEKRSEQGNTLLN